MNNCAYLYVDFFITIIFGNQNVYTVFAELEQR